MTSLAAATMEPITIHPDALPCLKRQQLENLCIRLGVKSSGKKSELIARLEGFAMGKTLSTTSMLQQQQLSSSSSASSSSIASLSLLHQQQYDKEEEGEEDKENQQDLQGMHFDGQGDDTTTDTSMMMPYMASIRVISKPRESHFAAAAGRPSMATYDDGMEEAGVVLPSAGDSQGSLSSLRRKGYQAVSAAFSDASNRQPSGSETIASKANMTRSTSSGSIYPWKKLLTHGRKKSTETLSAQKPEQQDEAARSSIDKPTPAQETTNEMGLGLHASASHSSISSTVRRWLKGGEGGATVTSTITQENNTPAREPANPREVLSPGAKRKGSLDGLQPEQNDNDEKDQAMSPTTPQEVPKRRIKPRPSRAARQSTVNGGNSSIVAESSQKGNSVEAKVLAQMHARLAAARTALPEAAEQSDKISSGADASPLLPASPLKSVSSRTRGRFSSEHEKQFGQMSSIATHYSATRRDMAAAKAFASPSKKALDKDVNHTDEQNDGRVKRARVDDGSDVSQSISPDNVAQAQTTASPSKSQVVTIASPSNAATAAQTRTEAEREAIRRKLAIARHRRKSSMAAGGSGRKSLGRAGVRVNGKKVATGTMNNNSSAPSSKLSLRTGAFAQKLSGAVRGFMGAATRGLTSTTTVDAASVAPADTVPATVKAAPSPSKTLNTGNSVTRKRSTFDLQASLARRPVGYTPYSGRETVEILAKGASNAAATSTTKQRSSNVVAFPPSASIAHAGSSAKSVHHSNADVGDEQAGEPDSSYVVVDALPPPPPPPSISSPPPRNAGRKMRSSTSRAARTSAAALRSPRRSSNILAAATTSPRNVVAAAAANASINVGNGAKRRQSYTRRTPSLQVANQSMASSLLRQRRMRTNALRSGDSSTTNSSNDNLPPSLLKAPRQRASTQATLPPTGLSLASSSSSPSRAAGAGHGSPRKQIATVQVHGQGRGQSNIIEYPRTSPTKTVGKESATNTIAPARRSTRFSTAAPSRLPQRH